MQGQSTRSVHRGHWEMSPMLLNIHDTTCLGCICMNRLRDTFTSTLLLRPSVCAAWTAATAVLFQLALSRCALDGWYHEFDPTTCLMTRDDPAYMSRNLFTFV
ncbi:hypothetical protein BDW42DRAFT_162893, partial [Aspergillus taichungensis]